MPVHRMPRQQRRAPVAHIRVRMVQQRPQVGADWTLEAIQIRRDARRRVLGLLERVDQRRRRRLVGHAPQQREAGPDNLGIAVVDRAREHRRHPWRPRQGQHLHGRDSSVVVTRMAGRRRPLLQAPTRPSRATMASASRRVPGSSGAPAPSGKQDCLRAGWPPARPARSARFRGRAAGRSISCSRWRARASARARRPPARPRSSSTRLTTTQEPSAR